MDARIPPNDRNRNQLYAMGIAFLLDALTFIYAPLIICWLGDYTSKRYEIVFPIFVLSGLICMFFLLFIYTTAMVQAFELLHGHVNRWAIYGTLVLTNLIWTLWSLISVVCSSVGMSTTEEISSTLFGCNIISLVFHALKFTTYTYLFFVIIAEELP